MHGQPARPAAPLSRAAWPRGSRLAPHRGIADGLTTSVPPRSARSCSFSMWGRGSCGRARILPSRLRRERSRLAVAWSRSRGRDPGRCPPAAIAWPYPRAADAYEKGGRGMGYHRHGVPASALAGVPAGRRPSGRGAGVMSGRGRCRRIFAPRVRCPPCRVRHARRRRDRRRCPSPWPATRSGPRQRMPTAHPSPCRATRSVSQTLVPGEMGKAVQNGGYGRPSRSEG
jgi:hypothetical protein